MLVLLRSTTACNLRCTYCSVACGDETLRTMTEDDCHLLLEQLPVVLRPGETVSYLWHGGEPTLLPPDCFTAMQGILSRIERQGHPVRCLMQTNGYAVSEAWLDALRKFDVGVGVSVDGPSFLHDTARLTSSGYGSYERVMHCIEAVRQNEISVSLLCTVRKEHIGNETHIVDWLKQQDLPIRFNPLLRLGRSRDALSSEEYFIFLRNILIQALERDISHSIEPVSWMLTSVITDAPPTECVYSGECGLSLFSIGPGGVVGACNRSDDSFGNIHDTPLSALRECAAWRQRRQRVERLRARCGDCAIWAWCHGGCPEVEGSPDPHGCEARKAFFTWLRGEGLDMYHKALLRRREYLRQYMHQLRQARDIVSRQSCHARMPARAEVEQ